MAKETIEALQIRPDGIYVDVTFGGGGHSRLILDKLGEKGRLVAFDQDGDAKSNVIADNRLIFVHHNFQYLKRFLKLHKIEKVDGILADLGVSSHQLDQEKRGFSFRFHSKLDMRMNQEASFDAAQLIKEYAASELQQVFSTYGEVRNAKSLALKIVQERQIKPIQYTTELITAIEPLIRGQRNRYLAQVFQALRIEVNKEMEVLENFLHQTLEVLKPGGCLVVIAYHSIEDRMVKNFLKTGNIKGNLQKDFYGNIYRPFDLLIRKALAPGDEEVTRNPRSRSAKMRTGKLKEGEG